MSWAEEDWTVGLTGRVLQKVKELQVNHERLSRENKQKQLQLDNIHISLEKQTVKYEEVRVELQSVQRELQSVQEEAKAAVTSQGRLTQEVQTKQAQVCSLEGQLDSARTLNNKLTQEIKRLEAELEKLQNSSRLADTSLFSTPSWINTSPWEHNGSRQEGQRDEAPARAHSRRLQFSDVASPSAQHQSTPYRHPSDQSDIFSTPMAPWEREDSKPAAKRRIPPSPLTPTRDGTKQERSEQEDYGKDSRTATDLSSSELRNRISALEEELSGKARTLKSIQNEQMQSKKELAAKELSLQRARDELSVAQTRIVQDSDRASAAEHRLKQLQEELKCQRQNAESSRLQHQQRTKELEKQHQRDLTELQRERQSLERQHQQEVNKLNQELQHARTQHNALQAQADKLALQKQELEKDLNSVKEKLKWTEGQLTESQKKETQTQAKLTEAVREAEGLTVSLEQSRKRERALEEEGRRLAEEQADALRLVKELQEQKLVSAPPLPPAQFCPAGQSFTPQSSFSHPARTQTKRPTVARAEHKSIEEEDFTDRRRTEVAASYPSDREPGEGIDSEHITALSLLNPECVEKAGHRGKSNKEESENIGETITCDVSGPNTNSPLYCAAGTLSSSSVDREGTMKTQPVHVCETSIPFEDLKKENAVLRSELQDLREELQKRLEDLETQRRAETEARTRLKQLSRKQASQATEKEEKLKEWKAQLESERAETERLKKTVAALEVEMKREGDERDRIMRGEQEEEEERSKEQDDRECEMMELNIQLKKQLVDIKTQLAVEREERKQEEEKDQMKNKDMNLKMDELTAELERLKFRLKEESREEEKLSATNQPLTYLSLHDNELNSNILCSDNKTLPSPEQHLLLCQTTNQRNMLVSQSTAETIQKERNVINPENSPLSDVLHGERDTSDLVEEVEHLKREHTKEMERANHCQVKLEALQSQVTRQTLQLTTAFEKQSQHIAGLLAELQEKESLLLSQGDELLQCKKELQALRVETEKSEEVVVVMVEDEGHKVDFDDKMHQIPDFKSKQEIQSLLSPHATKSVPDDNLTRQRDETPSADGSIEDTAAQWSGDHPDFNKIVAAEDQCSKIGGTADSITELLALQQENQLLKQRLEEFVLSDTRSLSSQSANQEDRAEQSQNTTVSSVVEEMTHNILNDVLTDRQKTPLQNVNSAHDDEGQALQMDGKTNGAEEDEEEESQVNHLQEQVEALQLKIRALSEEMQQQAEELALWRLASQPAPTFDVDEQQESGEQTDEIIQSKAQTLSVPGQVQTPTPATPRRQESITVIREDDLVLSCTSNKMQGRMLFSRLQNRNLPEPKTLQPSKKPAAVQEFNQDSTNMDQESEKENQDLNVFQQSGVSPAQYKVMKDTEVVQTSEKTLQQLVTKDTHNVSGAGLTKSDSHAGKHDVKPNPSRETNEMTTASKSSATDVRSVSVQTDEGLSNRGAPTLCVSTQTEEEEEDAEELVDSPPVSPVMLPDRGESDSKMLFAGSFPIPADPARLAERIRRNRTQLSAAFDDTEYEPYGLPEVVMKGFADIPSGPSCPYIVRRGLLGTTVVPASQTDAGKEEETD